MNAIAEVQEIDREALHRAVVLEVAAREVESRRAELEKAIARALAWRDRAVAEYQRLIVSLEVAEEAARAASRGRT